MSAYGLTFAGFLLLSGRASDLYGRRRLFGIGLVVFALSSLAAGLAPSEAVLIGARAVQGVGAAIRTGIEWAQAHDIALTGIMAGDDQDDPREIVLLARSIVENGADFVQGSRYVKGGRRLNQPLSRTIMTRGYSVLFSLCVLRPVTDATNGFKLFRTEVTRSMNLRQPWLDRYELEPYLLYEAIRRRLRVAEIPVTKYYPADRAVGYTKMRAILDWWRISRPMVLLTLRLRR